ncbi:MAG: hypothetical protein ACQEQC_08830 [Elusimicrobiota bacterium]
MKKITICLVVFLFAPAISAGANNGGFHHRFMMWNRGRGSFTEPEDRFVYPFLTRISLPELPGKVSMRTAVIQNTEDTDFENDFLIHLDAGLYRDLGLHIRSDGLIHEEFAVTGLQYAIYKFKSPNPGGISIMTSAEVPTVSSTDIELNYWSGVSFMYKVFPAVIWDSNLLINFDGDILKYETALVSRFGHNFYPVVELRGFANKVNESYALGGVKLKLTENAALGIGLQVNLQMEGEHHINRENYYRQHGQKGYFMFETIF